MSMFKRGGGVLIALLAGACSGGSSITPTPTPSTFSLSGQVIDGATGSGISAVTVRLLADCDYNLTMTDDLGNYTLAAKLGNVFCTVANASKGGYEDDARPLAFSGLNFHLYRIERLTAGESTTLTVRPDDTICPVDLVDVEAGLGAGDVCRTVRVMASSDGILTVEADPAQAGTPLPDVELQTTASNQCCGYIVSIVVRAGTEVMANVGMRPGSTASQSFVVKTSIVSR